MIKKHTHISLVISQQEDLKDGDDDGDEDKEVPGCRSKGRY